MKKVWPLNLNLMEKAGHLCLNSIKKAGNSCLKCMKKVCPVCPKKKAWPLCLTVLVMEESESRSGTMCSFYLYKDGLMLSVTSARQPL